MELHGNQKSGLSSAGGIEAETPASSSGLAPAPLASGEPSAPLASATATVTTEPKKTRVEARPELAESFGLDGLEDLDDEFVNEPMPFSLFVLFEAALAPLSLLAGYFVGIHPLEQFAWEGRAVAVGVLAAVPMLAFLALIVLWPIGPFARIKAFFDRELAPALRGCEWPDLAVLSTAAGVGEEMLFRGVIQGALARALGPAPAILLASGLFGLLHPISLTYVVVAGLLGAYLGAVWLVTGNLLSVMVAHAVYDFVALVLLLRSQHASRSADPT